MLRVHGTAGGLIRSYTTRIGADNEVDDGVNGSANLGDLAVVSASGR